MTKIKLDNTSTITRPDLEINFKRKPGAYVIKNGIKIPDLNDDAMKTREEFKIKKEAPINPLIESSEKLEEDSNKI